jgi:glycogen(starch) synthase
LIDVEESSDAIVAGFRRLRDRFPAGIDLGVARHALAERFGYQAVARLHHDTWFPTTRAAAGDDARPGQRV